MQVPTSPLFVVQAGKQCLGSHHTTIPKFSVAKITSRLRLSLTTAGTEFRRGRKLLTAKNAKLVVDFLLRLLLGRWRHVRRWQRFVYRCILLFPLHILIHIFPNPDNAPLPMPPYQQIRQVLELLQNRIAELFVQGIHQKVGFSNCHFHHSVFFGYFLHQILNRSLFLVVVVVGTLGILAATTATATDVAGTANQLADPNAPHPKLLGGHDVF
mmetsp:Transcript_24160/g.50447  ORF Transcript_24160/g.50447 Transcript_24160/m.50447 type:complete len:213 (+) Transcript_24160:162-800(+)